MTSKELVDAKSRAQSAANRAEAMSQALKTQEVAKQATEERCGCRPEDGTPKNGWQALSEDRRPPCRGEQAQHTRLLEAEQRLLIADASIVTKDAELVDKEEKLAERDAKISQLVGTREEGWGEAGRRRRRKDE